MESFPLISVLIPTYNRRQQVHEAVFSVLHSTFQNFEIIVVDDGSTDGTVDHLLSLGFSPPSQNSVDPDPSQRLLLLSLPHCGFPGKVRNIGATLARGKYLAFLDSDDLWLPTKLQEQLSALEKASLGRTPYRLCHTRELWIRQGKVVSQRKQKHKREGDVFEDSLKKCILGPSTVLIEKSLFREQGGFREDLQVAEDYELWVRITATEPVVYVPEPLVVKRGGNMDQLSSRYPYIEPFRLQALKALVDRGFFDPYPQQFSKALQELIRKCQIHAQGCCKRGKLQEAAYWEQELARYKEKLTQATPSLG